GGALTGACLCLIEGGNFGPFLVEPLDLYPGIGAAEIGELLLEELLLVRDVPGEIAQLSRSLRARCKRHRERGRARESTVQYGSSFHRFLRSDCFSTMLMGAGKV